MYDAQYRAARKLHDRDEREARGAGGAATTVTPWKYASVAKMRTGDAICSSCAFGPTRKALLARPSTLPTEYFHANCDGSPRSSAGKEKMEERLNASPIAKQPIKPISRSSQVSVGQQRSANVGSAVPSSRCTAGDSRSHQRGVSEEEAAAAGGGTFLRFGGSGAAEELAADGIGSGGSGVGPLAA